MNEENVKLFEELLLSTKRDGIDKLLEFIRKSDFYTAPASTRFHLSCDGGLTDNAPMGHGSKSVIMLQQLGVKLTKDELYAILWHMGFTVPKEDYNTLGKAFEMYPLALALHEADLEATYLLEKEMK